MATSKTKKPKPQKKIKTQATSPTKTVKDRTDCSGLVSTKAVQSPIWAAQPALQDAGNKLIAAGTVLDQADQAAIQADLAALAAHTTRDNAVVEWDAAFDVYSSLVSQYSKNPADVAGLALNVAQRSSHTLAMPLGLEVKFDAAQSVVDIHVKPAPGMNQVEIQFSATPSDANSWKRLKGNGLRRKVADLTPGIYWVRACSVRSDDESDFTTPVAVTVK